MRWEVQPVPRNDQTPWVVAVARLAIRVEGDPKSASKRIPCRDTGGTLAGTCPSQGPIYSSFLGGARDTAQAQEFIERDICKTTGNAFKHAYVEARAVPPHRSQRRLRILRRIVWYVPRARPVFGRTFPSSDFRSRVAGAQSHPVHDRLIDWQRLAGDIVNWLSGRSDELGVTICHCPRSSLLDVGKLHGPMPHAAERGIADLGAAIRRFPAR